MKTISILFRFVLLLIGGLCQAQQYTISLSSVGSGGTLTGGGYSIDSAIGESAASIELSGGSYTLQSSFWPGIAALALPQWVLRDTNGPPARFGHAMAYDSARGVTVMYGGGQAVPNVGYVGFGEVWEWSGAQWRQRTTYNSSNAWHQDGNGYWVPNYGDTPAGRLQHAMAYDSRRGRVVMFGGRSASPGGGDFFFGDTWEWDGLRWQFRATNGPVARISHTMAYDESRGVTVMFGGFSPGDFGNVWEWDGVSWKGFTPTNGPASNYSQDAGSMAYDSVAREIFYGPTTDGFTLGFFWSWDGHDWHSRGAGFTPTIYSPAYGAMVFDDFGQQFVYFGGQNGYQNFFGGNTTAFLKSGTSASGSWSVLPDAGQGSLFSGGEFIHLSNFVAMLNAHADPVSLFLWNQFPPDTQQTLANPNATSDETKSVLRTNLSNIIKGSSIFDASRFAGVNLSVETLVLQRLNPKGPDLIRFNRLLLEDAYPIEILRSPPTPSGRMRLAAAYDSRRHAVVTMGGLYDPGASQPVGNETWELLAVERLVINEQPLSQYRAPGDTAVFRVAASGPKGTALNYQWSFGNQPLTDGGRISGAQSAALQIANVGAADVGQYQVQVSAGRDAVQSSPAILTLNPKLQIFRIAPAFNLLWGSSNIVLEHSDVVTSNWVAVPGANSPFDIAPVGAGKFFRLRPTE